MHFDVIAFDADDTLWRTEHVYRAAEGRLLDLLVGYGVVREQAQAEFHRVELANLPDFGYGVRGYLISMIQAALALTGAGLRGADVQAIIETGREMAHQPIDFLPGVQDALGRLGRGRTLALVTKGDVLDQERKVAKSGLSSCFRHVEILTDKTPATYAALFARLGVDPARFLMVGNSLRSDILPVLALGGWAVHVPYELTWAHESAGEIPPGSARFFEIQHLGELPALVERLES